MTTTTTSTNPNTIAVINASIALVSMLVPAVAPLILGIKTIWLSQNPGKTDNDWLASLAADATQLTSEADAQLAKDGFVRDPATGEWTKPAPPSTTAP